MSSSVYCPGCGQEIGYHLMSQIHELTACPKCGLTADEAAMKMQEELSGMFNKNLSMSEHIVEPQTNRNPIATEPTVQAGSALGYSSSQHYYPPPAHLASKNIVEAPKDEDADLKHILMENNIDWRHLLTSQFDLFKRAAADQRGRLIELWRICPPEQAKADGLGGWQETTVEQEEELARIRYERSMADHENAQRKRDDMVIAQDADMDSAVGDLEPPQAAEPYMRSGYEILAERDYNNAKAPSEPSYKHALDPAFSGREWWRDFMGNQSIENQYGAFEHMAQFHPKEIQIAQEDEEML